MAIVISPSLQACRLEASRLASSPMLAAAHPEQLFHVTWAAQSFSCYRAGDGWVQSVSCTDVVPDGGNAVGRCPLSAVYKCPRNSPARPYHQAALSNWLSSQMSSVASTMFYAIWSMFAGFLIMKPAIPGWWIWYYYLCPGGGRKLAQAVPLTGLSHTQSAHSHTAVCFSHEAGVDVGSIGVSMYARQLAVHRWVRKPKP